MTAEARAILGPIAEAQDPRDFILQDSVELELREMGFKSIGKDSWSKKIRNRGAEGYVIVTKELENSYRVVLEARMPEPRPAAQIELQPVYQHYILGIYVVLVVQALIKAFKRVPPIRTFSYHEKNRYFDSMSMMSGHLILNALPPGTSFSHIYYRGGIGESEAAPVPEKAPAKTPPTTRPLVEVRDTPADLRHFYLPEAVDPKDFILKNAPRSYTAYFLNWFMKDDTAKVTAPDPVEAFKLANQVEYGRRAAFLIDDETGQRFVQNLYGQAILKEETVNPRDFILASTPWHDELVAAGFERTQAEATYPFNEAWFKTYPFMDGKIVILAEPHKNVPDEEVLNPTNPIIRLYCEYTNPREGTEYPIQVFQRWVPVPKLKQAMPYVDSAVKSSSSLEQLQKTLEYGFYRLSSWWPGPSAVADSLPQFRAALESRGWRFDKLNAIPMVGGGEVQEHVYKKVNKGTVWTLNASLTPHGKLFAFGSGFKVVMENDEPKDVDWPLAEQTQPEGMGVPEFAELVSAATEV